MVLNSSLSDPVHLLLPTLQPSAHGALSSSDSGDSEGFSGNDGRSWKSALHFGQDLKCHPSPHHEQNL